MDTSKETVASVRDMLAEAVFKFIEMNQELTQAARGKVSRADLDAFLAKVDRQFDEFEEEIQLIKKMQELRSVMNNGS